MGRRLEPSRADIAVGGTVGFDALADPNGTKQLRASGRARLYLHDWIWERTSPALRLAVAATWQGFPVSVEVGQSLHPTTFWRDHFDSYRVVGLEPDQAHVNLIQGARALTFDQWRAFVDEGRSRGLAIIAPIFAPNQREWEGNCFTSDRWDLVRAFAEYGLGLTIDSPPWYFLSHPLAYQRFVEQEVCWCRGMGIRSTWIISPPREVAGSFRLQTNEMMDCLVKKRCAPDAFIVENYMAQPPPDFPYVVGAEMDGESITSVALWIVRHIARE